MKEIQSILQEAVDVHASDIFLVAGLPISYRKDDSIHINDEERLLPTHLEEMIRKIYEYADDRDFSKLEDDGDDDFSLSVPHLSRFRVSAYKQRGTYSAVIRVIAFELPNPSEIGISNDVIDLVHTSKGMVLVTGSAGSGKSTTLACMIEEINKTKAKHIITLEDPIEYLHRHKSSIVSQREIGEDTASYIKALRAALRQSPDVILLGEMRDYETISVAMTAAETGHLLLSTLHTVGAANTINRIIDVFPPTQQKQIAVQLSLILDAVVSQHLVPKIGGGVIPVFEIMTVTPAIRNMIRENKIPQIDALVQQGRGNGIVSMDYNLKRLYEEGVITKENALLYATNRDFLARQLR